VAPDPDFSRDTRPKPRVAPLARVVAFTYETSWASGPSDRHVGTVAQIGGSSKRADKDHSGEHRAIPLLLQLERPATVERTVGARL
jgi:hypothetical protein